MQNILGRYYDTYLPFLLEACNDESPDVRQVFLSNYYQLSCALVNLDCVENICAAFFRQLLLGLACVLSLADRCSNLLSKVAAHLHHYFFSLLSYCLLSLIK